MTQMEALWQKQRYDQKASTVTLNKGDVVIIRNDQFVGKRKLKDCWGDEVYPIVSVSPETEGRMDKMMMIEGKLPNGNVKEGPKQLSRITGLMTAPGSNSLQRICSLQDS